SYMGLKKGQYHAGIDPAQLEELEWNCEKIEYFEIKNAKEGDFIDTLEFNVLDDAIADKTTEASQEPMKKEDAVIFRVQVFTSSKRCEENQVSTNWGKLDCYYHDGLYKYTLGEFRKLKE